MTETATTQMKIWQRMPPGWIEFRALDDPEAWWNDYLASDEGLLTDDAKEALTSAFRIGVESFANASFDFAGVHLTFEPKPAVWLMCTQVVRTVTDGAAAKAALDTHRALALAKLGPNGSATTFRAADGRVGTISYTAVAADIPALNSDGVLLALGELPLPDRLGSAFLTGFCSDRNQFEDLLIRIAFTLDTLQVLPEGEQPATVPDAAEHGAPIKRAGIRDVLDQG